MRYLIVLVWLSVFMTACHEGAFHWVTPEAGIVPTVEIVTCEIKGNINAKGEKIYHTPESKNYDQTVIDDAAGELWFCTEEDAKAEGFRKAGG